MMFEIGRAPARAFSLGSLVGAVLLLSALPPERTAAQPDEAAARAAWAAEPCVSAICATVPSLSPPPVGEGSFRPSHFSVALVAVVVRRNRALLSSRVGGLYGP